MNKIVVHKVNPFYLIASPTFDLMVISDDNVMYILCLGLLQTPFPSLITEWFSVTGLVHSRPSSQGPEGSIPKKWGPEGRSHDSPTCCKYQFLKFV